MGKNHGHKKRLKSEKSKTQLKNAAKELLKRQNVTQTEFKIKPIVIAPQLQSKTTEDGRKELNVDVSFFRNMCMCTQNPIFQS